MDRIVFFPPEIPIHTEKCQNMEVANGLATTHNTLATNNNSIATFAPANITHISMENVKT